MEETTQYVPTQKGRSLNTLIGLREKTETTAKGSMSDMMKKFKSNQGLFQGERRTFQAFEGFADEPSKRGYRRVASNVKSQLDYMAQTLQDFLEITFSIEKTNASGTVTADLIVDGENWGTYTSLELLRMRSFLDGSKLKSIYNMLPTRSLTERWSENQDVNYADMDGIFETPLETGNTRTTTKEDMIVHDPHAKDNDKRQPVVTTKTNQVNTGEYTVQKFSGELNISQVAVMQKRLDRLHTAVIEALGRANAVEAQKSDLGSKLFTYLHEGI